MSRLAALGTGKVHAAPISQVVVPVAEERGLRIMQIESMPFIIDALWTSRKYADENPQVVQNVVRAYTRAIAVLVKDRDKSLEVLRKYMRTSDRGSFKTATSGIKKNWTGCRYHRRRRSRTH